MKSLAFKLVGAVATVVVATVCFPSQASVEAVNWNAAQRVADGVDLVSLSRIEPRLIKASAMRVDLSMKSFFFTGNGRDARWGTTMPYYTNLVVNTRRMTAEEFLMNARAPVELGGRGLDMVAAFNTALWTPCPEPVPTPFGQLHGLNVSDGVVVSPTPTNRVRGIFVVWKNGGMDILPTPLPQSRIKDAWIAHSGWDVVLKDGKPEFTQNDTDIHPRTVLGLSRDRRWFYVLAVEGRHEGVSIGADYRDLADMMLSLGASDAINMDGGGSTELVRWDDASQRQVTCFTQETPPRRDALFIGVCRRSAAPARAARLDDAHLFEAAIDGDRTRSAGLYHRYEFNDVQDTQPPPGYRPFYIAHYGRHGSRYQIDESHQRSFAVLEAADKINALHAPGKELLRRVRPLVDAHKGMFGALSKLGAQEQAQLARRMYRRFPSVFSGKGRIRCQASVKHRCLSSMANFACALKGEAPQLDFEFMTGDRYMEVVARRAQGSQSDGQDERKKRFDELKADLLKKYVAPERIMSLLFRDSPAMQKTVGDPRLFVAELFELASAFQPLERELGGLDVYEFFTRDEILSLARFWDCRYYLGMGNSAEFGDGMIALAGRLAKDIAARADEAARSGGICADLRFGHDSALFPLVGFLGVEGAGERVPAAESWKRCQMWRDMPMAANIQLIFYRNGSGERLVKVLYNERETRLQGLTPVSGTYYRWGDLRERLMRTKES